MEDAGPFVAIPYPSFPMSDLTLTNEAAIAREGDLWFMDPCCQEQGGGDEPSVIYTWHSVTDDWTSFSPATGTAILLPDNTGTMGGFASGMLHAEVVL